MSIRDGLVTRVQDQLGDGYAVYGTGVPIVKTPCVVVNPSNPYQVPTTMGADARTTYAIEFWVVTNRTSPGDAMDHLEEMAASVKAAIKTGNPAGRWTSFGRFGSTTVGDKEYATAVVESLFVASDQ